VNPHEAVMADITAMIRAILDVSADLGPEITAEATFFEDLGMASIDLAALGGRVYSQYGRSVNFAAFFAELDVDSISQLRVGDVVDYIVTSTAKKASLT
jgi:acyl carrier protein